MSLLPTRCHTMSPGRSHPVPPGRYGLQSWASPQPAIPKCCLQECPCQRSKCQKAKEKKDMTELVKWQLMKHKWKGKNGKNKWYKWKKQYLSFSLRSQHPATEEQQLAYPMPQLKSLVPQPLCWAWSGGRSPGVGHVEPHHTRNTIKKTHYTHTLQI